MSISMTLWMEFSKVLYISMTIMEGLTSPMDSKIAIRANSRAFPNVLPSCFCCATCKTQKFLFHLDLKQVLHKVVGHISLS